MDNWRRFTPLALWSLGLGLSNGLLHGSSPQPQQMSGNGILPHQLVFLATTIALTIGWGTSLTRVVRAYVTPLRYQSRMIWSIGAAILALAFVSWSYSGLHQYERTLHKFYGLHSLINQYTLNYWSISLPLWVGFACAIVALACLWPSERRKGP
jgi:hypothetical protein